jgi:quercetin dioxygenase-like cupin family protein
MPSHDIPVTHSSNEDTTTPEPGLRRQVMSSSPATMLVRHTMTAGWVGTRHSHPHEQMVYILRGPGNVPHQAFALEDSEVLDIFTPAREDYAL